MTPRWITAKVFWMTMLATSLTFAMVLGTLLWSAFLSNRQAALDSVVMVKGGIENIARQLRQDRQTDQPLVLQDDQVAAALRRNPDAQFARFYTLHKDTIYLVVVGRGPPQSVRTQPFDEKTVNGIGAMFLLNDLQISANPQDNQARLPLSDVNGVVISHLVWSPSQPGGVTIGLLALPISAALSLFLVLAIAILAVARGSARALDERDAETTLIARRDSLTDMPNRTAFGEHLTELMHASQHEVTVLVMDINNFKRINDTVGHGIGDEVIADLSIRLQAAITNNGYIARVGGDEFRAVFSGYAAIEERDQFFEKLATIQSVPICIHDRPFEVTLAVGYASGYPQDSTASDLIRLADLAMYEAKNLGLHEPLAYHDGIESDQSQKQKIEDALRKALATGSEFEVYYQPIICAKTGKMVLAEALMRWTSAELGRMSPDRFIPIAESSGLIIPLGKSLMHQVCKDLRTWSDLNVSVNLSPAQLRDPHFMSETAKIVERHGVRPSRIEFELTEGIFVEDPTLAGGKLAQLRKMGHTMSLDDFGTGFSSIGYLRRIKFDKLKIDKTFIDDLGTTPNAEDLLKSLALLAKSFDLRIVAEGVEREVQYETLYDLGYDYIQGYYCGKAMPFNDLFSIFTGQLSKIDLGTSQIAKAS